MLSSRALSFYALSVESAALVATILSIEPISVALLAWLLLRKSERLCQKLVESLVITALGTILVIL